MFEKESLTRSNITKLERIQKTTFHNILGDNYRSYSTALRSLWVKKLSERRKLLCLKFARKAERHHKFSKWFNPSTKGTATRQTQSKYFQVFARKKRFRNSPIPYRTELLNNFYIKKKKLEFLLWQWIIGVLEDSTVNIVMKLVVFHLLYTLSLNK
jgi:hypothetical protein